MPPAAAPTGDNDPLPKLKELAAEEARRREAEEQHQKLLRRVEAEYDNLRYYGERTGAAGSNRGLAEQIARYLAAVRAAGGGGRFEALQPNENPVWTAALAIYRLCDRGDIDGATAKLDEAEALGPSQVRSGIIDALMRTIPDAIGTRPAPSEIASTHHGQVEPIPAVVRETLTAAADHERIVLGTFWNAPCGGTDWNAPCGGTDWNAGIFRLWELWRRELPGVAPPQQPKANNYREARAAVDMFLQAVEAAQGARPVMPQPVGGAAQSGSLPGQVGQPMSNVPLAVTRLRKLIQEQRALLCLVGYRDMDAGKYVHCDIDPEPYRHLWALWRSWLPLHGAPDAPPPVQTEEEAHRALDSLLRKLDELFGPVPGEETPEACSGLLLDDALSVPAAAEPPHQAPAVPDHRPGDQSECSVRLIGEVWHLRYRGEAGDYPAKDNQAIGWLATKLLASPNRQLTVAELRGDPEGKVAADALLGGVKESDRQKITEIRKRLQDIDDITEGCGGSEALEAEKVDLLKQLEGPPGKTLESNLKAAHHNMATQLRSLQKKLKKRLPQLAAHLKATLKLDYPEFGYYPPDPPPAWLI